MATARRWETWVAVLGVALFVFGLVWLTAVFPGLKKIPTDWDQTIDFQGTYAVVDEQDFLQRLLSSTAVQRLVASPATLELLGDQSVQRLLAGDALRALLAEPALLQQLMTNLPALAQATDPAIQGALANPDIQQILGNPQAVELLTNPAVQRVLADPVAAAQSGDPAVLQILASPLIQQLAANPTVVQALAAPAIQQLLADPELLSLLTNPIVQGLLTDPAVPALLSDTVIQGLLLDPEGLALVVDSRTRAILSDPTNLPMVEFPVNFHRVRAAERSDGNLLFLHQDFDATVLGTGQPLDQFTSQATLAVDRKTREYAPGGTEPRRGQFAFPFDVEKEQTYPIWVHEVFRPVDAVFVETGEVNGLEVYVFRSGEQGLTLPAEPKRNLGIAEALEILADVEMVTKTEPLTGITIDVESDITYRLNNPAVGNPVVFHGEIQYSPESITTSVDDAEDARRLLFWAGGFLPWFTISLGALLALISGMVVSLRTFKSLG